VVDALIAVDNALRRDGLRNDIALRASGKIATGGDLATHLALGADLVHIGRGFLFSIGCIQALRCHTNTCRQVSRRRISGFNPGWIPRTRGCACATTRLRSNATSR
jgi:hypothetical protein